jgi:transposase
MKTLFRRSLINRPIQNYRYHERIKLSDVERWQAAGMVIGGMSYRQTTERFNVSHSVIIRLKQRVNQTGRTYKTLFRRSLINRPIQNYRYHERILYVIQLSDRVYNVTFPA